jgi:hypothetical protein
MLNCTYFRSLEVFYGLSVSLILSNYIIIFFLSVVCPCFKKHVGYFAAIQVQSFKERGFPPRSVLRTRRGHYYCS